MSSHPDRPIRRSLAAATRLTAVCVLAAGLSVLAGCGGDHSAAAGGDSANAVVTPTVNKTSGDVEAKLAEKNARRAAARAGAEERARAEAGEESKTAPGIGNGARITFAKRTHDFGAINDTQKYETSYRFTNTGTGKLIITDIKAACGCTVPTLEKKEFMPGEGDEIKVVFDPKGKSGRTPKNLSVYSNGDSSGVTTLSFSSLITPLLDIEGKFVKFGDLPLNEGHTRIYPVRYQDADLTFQSIDVNHPYITGRLLREGIPESGAGGNVVYRADIEIKIDEAIPWGSLYAVQMKINVNGRAAPQAAPTDWQYTVYLQGNVFGSVKCSSISSSGRTMESALLPIGSIGGDGTFSASTRLAHSGGKPFKILEMSLSECNLPGIKFRSEPAGPASHRVYISGDTGTFKGKVEGFLNVITDVPGEGPLAIRIIGTVR